MIKPDKLSNALYALQGVLIRGRTMAYNGAPARDLADLLDAAETLPRFIASPTDETEKFRLCLASIAERHKCAFVLQYL